MLKLLGSLCILAAGAAIRTLQIKAQRRELDTLHGLLSAWSLFADGIRLERTPLPRLLERAERDCEGDTVVFLTAVHKDLTAGKPLPNAWRRAAQALPIAERERRVVAELGEKLCGDEEQVCKGIQLASNCLAESLSEKQKSQREREKRSTALCLSGAALLIILLI